MDEKIIAHLAESLQEVFTEVAKVAVTVTSSKYHESGERFRVEVASVLGLTGMMRGQMVVAVTEDQACRFSSALLMGEPVPSFNEMAESGLCEMANMIAGKASSRLSQLGCSFDFSVPSIVRGQDVEIRFFPRSPVLEIAFASDWGPLRLILRVDIGSGGSI